VIKITLKFVGILFILSMSNLSISATYYIRPNGGDVDYPGSGIDQPCAWSHPFWALNTDWA